MNDSEQPQSLSPESSVADRLHSVVTLDALCDRFESAWNNAPTDPPRIEDYLAQTGPENRRQLLRWLLEIEVEYLQLAGKLPPLDSWERRFPEAADILRDVLQTVRERLQDAGTVILSQAPDSWSRKAVSAPSASVPAEADYVDELRQQLPNPARKPAFSEYCFISADGVFSVADNPEWNSSVDRDFRIGTLLQNRYLLTDILGRGGMGCVLLARDQLLHRDVAVKIVMTRKLLPGNDLQAALTREARLAASLNHRGIAMVYDFGYHAGKSFTVFEYVEGQTLRNMLKECGKLSRDTVRSLVRELAEALDVAHAGGVIHQDLKPENICITHSGQPKILDFGVARDLSRDFESRGFCGTPQYASPEQAAGSATDGRTDQYALGLLVYEMLSGRQAFVSADPLQLLQMHRGQSPESLATLCSELLPATVAAVHRALATRPGDRFATCREFADAVFDEPQTQATMRPLLNVPPEEQIDIYLCHVAANSLFARHLAEFLEQRGLTTWYYQRDAFPDLSFLRQTIDAVQRARIVLLLISGPALNSEEFSQQIRMATQRGRILLPVLTELMAEDFEMRQPSWRSLLGPATILNLTAMERPAVLQRILQALEQAGLQPTVAARNLNRTQPGRQPTGPTTASAAHGQIWATDSSQIDVHDLPELVFRNALVDDFLNRRNRYFLSGTKGLGKTMLLSYKRHLIAQRAAESGGEGSICFIPSGGPFLDLMSEMRTVSANYETSLADLSVTKRFWSVALRISAISHHKGCIASNEEFELKEFPQRFRRWLCGSAVAPSVVFKELTNLSVSQANSLVDDTETFLDEKLRAIHSATCFFVDKVDQAVRERSRDAWINIQAGLIEAAWEIMNANSHVRIYASIRQEAFSNYHSDVKSNLLGATTVLRYTDADLEMLMNRLTSCYESSRGFRDFIGMRVLQHSRRSAPEDSFRFLRRHTFGRPRDLVVIASELSSRRGLLSETKYCEIVRSFSARHLLVGLFDEMRVFLDCLGDPMHRERFLKCLTANILSRRELVEICARFNGIPDVVVLEFGEDSSEIFHPFEDLYLAGLLGIVTAANESERQIQRFRRPDDLVSARGTDLPSSPWYFIHPALSAYIRSVLKGSDFLHFEQMAAGDGLPWHAWDPICCEIEKHSRSVTDATLRQFTASVIREAREVLSSRTLRSLALLLQALPDWKENLRTLQQTGHEDLVLWIEELASTQR